MEKEKVLVISAHAVDFVWRCGGTIAQYAANGHQVKVVDITFGERGESNDVWIQNPGINERDVVEIRRKEATKCAEILGAEIEFLDWHDHLLDYDNARITKLAEIIKEFHPGIVLTHWEKDPLNYDHPNTSKATQAALRLAQVRGAVHPEWAPTSGVRTFMFEPDQPEFCDFKPDVYIDITDVMDKKLEAMNSIVAQEYLIKNYTARGEYRAYLAQRQSGKKDIKMAEAFKRFNCYVGKSF